MDDALVLRDRRGRPYRGRLVVATTHQRHRARRYRAMLAMADHKQGVRQHPVETGGGESTRTYRKPPVGPGASWWDRFCARVGHLDPRAEIEAAIGNDLARYRKISPDTAPGLEAVLNEVTRRGR